MWHLSISRRTALRVEHPSCEKRGACFRMNPHRIIESPDIFGALAALAESLVWGQTGQEMQYHPRQLGLQHSYGPRVISSRIYCYNYSRVSTFSCPYHLVERSGHVPSSAKYRSNGLMNDICLNATCWTHCWFRPVMGFSLLRPQRFAGVYIVTPFGPTLGRAVRTPPGNLVHLHPFPQPSS